MESSGSYQDSNQTFGYDSRSTYSGRLHLDLKELCSKRDKPDYDEIDLVSECSTPGAYVPGKFLQLCDFPSDTNNDALIWPVSLGGTIRSDADTQQLMHSQPRHLDEESFSFRQVGTFFHYQ